METKTTKKLKEIPFTKSIKYDDKNEANQRTRSTKKSASAKVMDHTTQNYNAATKC